MDQLGVRLSLCLRSRPTQNGWSGRAEAGGGILKDYPEYKVAVDGHTDNQPIGGALKKKFPTNMELSEARAVNAANALEEGGLSNATTQGYADTKPKAPNTTEAGRAKNRRVEVVVTK
ncbi:MAG: OmpA family protein [Nitrospira sp.]|nr:OmpA family protein [Nitrospira sp.]